MKENINELQFQLFQLYMDKFGSYEGGLNLSCPLIPRISESYFNNRVIIVGQETNTWYPSTKDDLLNCFVDNPNNLTEECLINRYDKFITRNAKTYKGKFWSFNRLLYREGVLKGKMLDKNTLGHCWFNLFSVEACEKKNNSDGRPTRNAKLAKKIISLQGSLLKDIISLLKPELILFLTGPSLDRYLINKSLNAKHFELQSIDERNILEKRMLARLKIIDKDNYLNDKLAIRAYHPSYFMARINTYKRLKHKISKENIKKTNAEYYTNTFINYLKKEFKNA